MLERKSEEINSKNKESFVRVFDQYVYKHVVIGGAEERVHERSTVKLELVIRTEPTHDSRSMVIASYIGSRSLRIRACDLMPVGLRLAVCSMGAAEVCEAWVHYDFGFGADEVSTSDFGSDVDAIPAFSNLLLFIRLVNVSPEEKPQWVESAFKLGGDERLEEIQRLIEKGLQHEAKDENLMALKLFTNALRKLRRLGVDAEKNPDDEKMRSYLVWSVAKRASQLSLNISQFPRALSLVRQALEVKPDDIDANFIRGCAYHALGKYELAKRSLMGPPHAVVVDPRCQDKLAEIDDHIRLAGREENLYDDDGDEDEVYSEELLKKLDRVMIAETIKSFIQKKIMTERDTIEISGGFQRSTLVNLAEELNDAPVGQTRVRALMKGEKMLVKA